ncbi:hypothetical protein RhiirA1_542200, partial [Rhizophagus irregularis]
MKFKLFLLLASLNLLGHGISVDSWLFGLLGYLWTRILWLPENTRSTTSGTTGSVNESLRELLQYSTPEHTCLESSPSSSLYLKPNDSELARVLNSDLSINNLSTSDTETKIWSNLNIRCIEKFGGQDHIKNDVSISDIMWASTTLPAYRSWNTMKNYYDDIDEWIAKISSF